MTNDSDVGESRRSVLRQLGAGAGASVLGFSSISSAAASNSSSSRRQKNQSRSDRVDPIEVNGRERIRVIRTAAKSEEFAVLTKKIGATDYQLRSLAKASVYEVSDPEGSSHQVVGMKLEKVPPGRRGRRLHGSSEDDESASIAFGLTDEEVVSAKVIFTEREWGSSGDVSAQSTRDTEATELSVSTKTLMADGGTVTEENSSVTLNSAELEESSQQISAQKSDGCWACTLVGDTLCGIGCAAGTAVICSAVGLGSAGLGGFACGAIVGALCAILMASGERYVGASCFADVNIEMACYHAGYCQDNPLEPSA